MNGICKLRKIRACEEAIEYIRRSKRSPKKLWKTCARADWMLWLLTRAIPNTKENQRRMLRMLVAIKGMAGVTPHPEEEARWLAREISSAALYSDRCDPAYTPRPSEYRARLKKTADKIREFFPEYPLK